MWRIYSKHVLELGGRTFQRSFKFVHFVVLILSIDLIMTGKEKLRKVLLYSSCPASISFITISGTNHSFSCFSNKLLLLLLLFGVVAGLNPWGIPYITYIGICGAKGYGF